MLCRPAATYNATTREWATVTKTETAPMYEFTREPENLKKKKKIKDTGDPLSTISSDLVQIRVVISQGDNMLHL
jgi:hypothetical protein